MGLCPFTHPSILSSERAATHTSRVTSRAAGLGAKGSPSRWAVPAQFHRNTAGLDVLLCEIFLQKVASLPFYLIWVFTFNSWELETLEYGRHVLSISTDVFMTFSAKVTSALSLRFPRVYEREK